MPPQLPYAPLMDSAQLEQSLLDVDEREQRLIASEMRMIRRRLRLFSDELAERFDTYKATISRWENSRMRFQLPGAVRAALYGLMKMEGMPFYADAPEATQRLDDLRHLLGLSWPKFIVLLGLHDKPMAINDALRAVRERLGLSQRELGLLLGTCSRTIYRWEHGYTRITQPGLVRYALLGLLISEFDSGENRRLVPTRFQMPPDDEDMRLDPALTFVTARTGRPRKFPQRRRERGVA